MCGVLGEFGLRKNLDVVGKKKVAVKGTRLALCSPDRGLEQNRAAESRI